MVVYRKESAADLETHTGNTAAQLTDQSSNEEEKSCGNLPSMVPQAILICRPNSHPFQERHLALDQPVKVGRSVARCRPAPNNAIFDCKVLSRNHALLWYENGKFYLQDTKSSNGTFVNNQRLSKGSEESPAREVCSGDIVQFGVDVVENSRKVTHGCIVATLKLFLPDGKEAKASPTTAVVPLSPGAAISTQDLYQLSQYLQEALHREQVLETKLATLQRVVANTQDASDCGWKALIDEDRLLSRIEALENQLQTTSKNFTEEKLREEIQRLQEDKDRYQDTAKESLRKVLQEKLEALRKVQDIEMSLSNTEDECLHIREIYESTQRELQLLAESSDQQIKETSDLTRKLKEADEKIQELTAKCEEEKQTLEEQLEDVKKQDQSLSAKVEALQADNNFAREQLKLLKARFEQAKKDQNNDDLSLSFELNGITTESQGTQVDIIGDAEELESSLKGLLKHTQDEIQRLRNQLQVVEADLEISRTKVQELNTQLLESRKEEEKSSQRELEMKIEIQKLEDELQRARDDSSNHDTGLMLTYQCRNNGQPNGDLSSLADEERDAKKASSYLQIEIRQLKELLAESREKRKQTEAQVLELKGDLDEVQKSVKKSADEAVVLHHQLQTAQLQAKDKASQVTALQEQLTKAETAAREAKQQATMLRERVNEEEQLGRRKQEETNSLRTLLEEEQKIEQKLTSALDQLKKQLQESQQSLKQSQNEAEHLRKKVKGLTEDLKNKTNAEKSASKDSNKNTAEYEALREECGSLHARIQAVEAEMKKYRNENVKLLADYKRLQNSYAELETLKMALENKGGDYWKEQLEKVKDEASSAFAKLKDAGEEILLLKEQYAQCNKDKAILQRELKEITEEFQLVSIQSKTVSACSFIPLLVLAVAALLAFYPSLSFFTATSDASNPT